MPSLAVKIGIVIAGLVLYFFAISALLNIRRDKSQQRVLFDSIDYNRDGVLTTQEIAYFQPCPQTNKTNLVTKLNTLGPRVSYDQFENDVSRNMIKNTIAPCASNVHLLANPDQISKRNSRTAVGTFFKTYDLDQDGVVSWNEYNLVNKYHGKNIPGSSDTFAFIDTNNDWEITRQQFLAANLKQLNTKSLPTEQTLQNDHNQGYYEQPRSDRYASRPQNSQKINDRYNEQTYDNSQRPRTTRTTQQPRRQRYTDPLDDPYYDPPRTRRQDVYSSRRAAERDPYYADYGL